ncbi:MAG: YcaO-like family protein [Arachnia sp.]
MDLRGAPSAEDLLGNAIGWRAGLGLSATALPTTLAEPVLHQWSALQEPTGQISTAGGAGRSRDEARGAAIGELIERYTAGTAQVEHRPMAQWQGPAYEAQRFGLTGPSHHSHPGWLADAVCAAYRLRDNEPIGVPVGLLLMDHRFGSIATSSGLAAAPTATRALLRAAQELLERDALMATWLHCLAPPARPLTPGVTSLAEPIGATAQVFDITQAWNPHPVAVVAGSVSVLGKQRHAFGLACRARWEEAVDKAALEWAQGIVFAGVATADDPPGLTPTQRASLWPAEACTTFDEHARFYTRRPDLWQQLPWFACDASTARPVEPPRPDTDLGPSEATELERLATELESLGIELLYRELTGPEAAACGVRVMRVLSPDLIPINADHRWPFLGAPAHDRHSRYPSLAPLGSFPSSFPHPLG